MTELKPEQVLFWLKQAGQGSLREAQEEIGLASPQGRTSLRKILQRFVDDKHARRLGRGVYEYIDREIQPMDWWNATDQVDINLQFPVGRFADGEPDGTGFGFECMKIYPTDVIVLAGVSNAGKTAFALNLAVENMGKYHVTIQGNEYSPARFKDRISHFNWVEMFDTDGKPKFDVNQRRQAWQDLIKQDDINIIDWINLTENIWMIGKVIESIQAELRNGIAIVVIQKAEGVLLGRGKDWSRDLASVYLAIDPGRLTVVKAKAWNGTNPNGKMFGFDIIEHGSRLAGIKPVRPCRTCRSTGYTMKGKCEVCFGKGYVEVTEE